MTWDPKVYTFLPCYTYDRSAFPRLVQHVWQYYECMPLSECNANNRITTIVTGNYIVFKPYTGVPGKVRSTVVRCSWVAVEVR